MSDPFVAEIRIFAGNFAPTGWAECNGQHIPISQNTALFSLLGTFYGGDGKSTFALPDLQGAAPMHQGQGAGLSDRFLGETSGSDTVTLLQTEITAHNHNVGISIPAGTSRQPPGKLLATTSVVGPYGPNSGSTTNLADQAVAPAGGDQPHNNLQPYLTLTFIIALQGVFPPRG